MILNLRLRKILKRWEPFWIEKGRQKAMKEFNPLLEKLRTSQKIELNRLNYQIDRKNEEYQKKLASLEKREKKLVETQNQLDIIHAESMRYYKNLKEDFEDQRRQKMIRQDYDKSSLDHLYGKSRKLLDNARVQ